ncbi:MAG TPA: AAA family ATPase [Acidobacteriota bacterium]
MQYELNLRDYIRIFQKRKWTIFLMPVLAGLLGYFLTPTPPVMWEASGKLRLVQRSAPLDLMMQTFYYYEEGSRLDTHAEVMLSREVLKEVANGLGLIPDEVYFDEDGEPRSDTELFAIGEGRVDYIGYVNQLRESTTPTVVEGTSILRVTVTRPSDEQAVRWVNAIMDTYAARNEYEVNQDVIEGVAFLTRQLRTIETELNTAQAALTNFLISNADRLSLAGDEINTTQEELQAVEADLARAELAIDFIDSTRQAGGVPRLDLISALAGESLRLSQLHLTLQALATERQRLLSYQTPDSPEVLHLEAEIDAIIEDLSGTLRALRTDLVAERDRLSAKFLALPANDDTLARLRREVSVNSDLYNQLRIQLQAAQLRDAEKTKEITVIERAVSAFEVTETSRGSRGLVAAAIGLLLGIIIALVAETLDTSIGAIADIEALLGLPVIGIIPPIDFDDIRAIVRGTSPQLLDNPDIDHLLALVTHYDPRSPVAEAYRALRTNVEKARAPVNGQVMIVTSSVLEEGKTTTIANLALAYAQMGRKTLLIAADMRRPDVHRIFGLPKEPGLVDVMTGSLPWESAVRGLSDILLGELSMDIVMLTPGMDNLHVLPSGANPLNPAELLTSASTAELIQALRGAFDIILIDTPPVIPVTDSAILAEHADGVVLVYEVGKVGRDVLKRATSHLSNVHADIWGIVMNDVKAEAETTLRDTDYYYYHYRYEDSAPQPGIRSRLGRSASRFLGGRRG